MKRRIIQASLALATLTASAAVWASTACCGDLQCCLERVLGCCF
jgi:hypothetical protein